VQAAAQGRHPVGGGVEGGGIQLPAVQRTGQSGYHRLPLRRVLGRAQQQIHPGLRRQHGALRVTAERA
jgi:hypothetical protein